MEQTPLHKQVRAGIEVVVNAEQAFTIPPSDGEMSYCSINHGVGQSLVILWHADNESMVALTIPLQQLVAWINLLAEAHLVLMEPR